MTFLISQKTYNKNYQHSEEEKLRFSIFVDNQKKIFRHNRLHSLGDVTFKLKSNQFADLTHAEFLKQHVRNAISLDNDRYVVVFFTFLFILFA